MKKVIRLITFILIISIGLSFFPNSLAVSGAYAATPPYPSENRLVKSACDSPMYLLQKDGMKLVTKTVGDALFGSGWESKVTALNCKFFSSLKISPESLTADNYSVAKPEKSTTPAPTPKPEPKPAPLPIPTPTKDPGKIPVSPITDHPRLWLNSKDLPRLRSWANKDNPVYTQGLLPVIQKVENDYNTKFFPDGKENPIWPEPGGITYWNVYPTEGLAEILAFASLIDPDEANRKKYATHSRNLLMHVMNEAVKGTAPRVGDVEVPYRDSLFTLFNRARTNGEAYGLTVDWLQASNTLTAKDKATIQKVFLLWSDQITKNGRAAAPVGIYNDPSLIADKKQLRWVANNYPSGIRRNLALMALSLDPADDKQVDKAQPESKIGNTVRSYLNVVLGANLYQQYALFGDQDEVSKDYKISPDGLGDANGGMSPESFLYGDSIGYVSQELLALHTAGFEDTKISGPQINFIKSNYWEKLVDGIFHSTSPSDKPPKGEYSYLGKTFQWAGYGDTLRGWVTPDWISVVAPIGLLDQYKENNDERLNKIKWIGRNVLQGGAPNFYNRIKTQSWDFYDSIFYFLLYDPKAAIETDPRSSLPLSFTVPSQGRLLARTDWTPDATWFSYLCSWKTIDHQHDSCNEFNFYRKGEWLTKEHTNYDGKGIGQTTDYHNTLSLKNIVIGKLYWFEDYTDKRGSQWRQGLSDGDPKVLMNAGDTYAYAQGDSTNLYNRAPGNKYNPEASASEIIHASRSILWIKPDFIVIYDRAASKSSGLFKKFNLSTIGPATIVGKTATETTPGGQKLYIQSLLPAGAVLTSLPNEKVAPAELEPTTDRLVIEDKSNPTNIRFLTVLQGADASTSQTVAKHFTNSSGTSFDGVIIKNMAVLFQTDITKALSKVTYTIPKTVTKQYITGLTPNTKYNIATKTTTSGITVTVTPGTIYQADIAGVIEK